MQKMDIHTNRANPLVSSSVFLFFSMVGGVVSVVQRVRIKDIKYVDS